MTHPNHPDWLEIYTLGIARMSSIQQLIRSASFLNRSMLFVYVIWIWTRVLHYDRPAPISSPHFVSSSVGRLFASVTLMSRMAIFVLIRWRGMTTWQLRVHIHFLFIVWCNLNGALMIRSEIESFYCLGSMFLTKRLPYFNSRTILFVRVKPLHKRRGLKLTLSLTVVHHPSWHDCIFPLKTCLECYMTCQK